MGPEGSRGFSPFYFKPKAPRQRGRSARGRMKGIQTARMYCRGQPYPRQAKITGEEGATLPEAIPLRISKEIPTLGEAVISVLNTHN